MFDYVHVEENPFHGVYKKKKKTSVFHMVVSTRYFFCRK